MGAPLITTSGGAGDVLSATGERRGVMGAPPPGVGLVPRLLDPLLVLALLIMLTEDDDPSPEVRSIGDAALGEDGPGVEFEVDSPGFVGA